MEISRRQVLQLGLAGFAGTFFSRKSLSAQSRKTLSIVQGATDDTQTQFSVVHGEGTELSFVVESTSRRRLLPDKVEVFHFPDQEYSVTQVFFRHLQPNEDYFLQVYSEGQIKDQRIFQTLDTTNEKLKFALCSCMHDVFHNPKIWKDLISQKPDVIFFIGDSTYADNLAGTSTPFTLWKRFAEVRQVLEIYHLPRLIPIIAVWDDHDFGENDGDSRFPYVSESAKNFLTFFPQSPQYCRYIERGPGISSCFSFRNQKIILMDSRTYRLPAGSKNRYAHWGKKQEEWALQKVNEADKVAWLLNGSQFFSDVRFQESVLRDHRVQLDGFIGELKKSRNKVLFASGDTHYGELMGIKKEFLGYETVELTSSSMHTPPLPGYPWTLSNELRIAATANRNYSIVEAEGTSHRLLCISTDKGIEYEHRVNF